MDLDKIFSGESKNIEYKVERPKDSKKYIKTVVAFANGHGGKIVFGADDITHEIKGIPEDILFAEMDAIANAISDSCEPMLVPDISLKEIKGKTLIVVEIAPGMQRPYYIKTMGIQDGTFVRVAGTSRPVESYMLKEIMLEGSGRSFDGIVIESQSVSDEEIKQVCSDMTKYAMSQCRTEEEKKQIRPLTKNQLISWELLVERGGRLLPTYGYNLLTGKMIPSVMSGIQCAVFKGKTRAVFVDRKEYDGPIYRQIDDAYEFVLRMIRMGANINGIVRQDIYEFPIGTVREMICNAVCHRSYFQPAYVQVALYDDRLEVTSPGMLSRDVTIEKMKEGYSKIRNRGIAKAFSYMKIVEGWGSGIPRMIEECIEYGLREPELIDAGGDFRINLYRKSEVGSISIVNTASMLRDSAGKMPESVRKESDSAEKTLKSAGKVLGSAGKIPKSAGKVPEKCRKSAGKMPESAGMLPEQQAIIYRFIERNGYITSAQVEGMLNVKERRARAILSKMVKENVIKKVGASKNTKYTFV